MLVFFLVSEFLIYANSSFSWVDFGLPCRDAGLLPYANLERRVARGATTLGSWPGVAIPLALSPSFTSALARVANEFKNLLGDIWPEASEPLIVGEPKRGGTRLHTLQSGGCWGCGAGAGTALGAGAGVAVVQCAVCLLPRHALGKSNFLLIFLPQFFFLGVSRRSSRGGERYGELVKQKQVTGSRQVSQVGCCARCVGKGKEGLEFMTPIIYEFEICLARCHSAGLSRPGKQTLSPVSHRDTGNPIWKCECAELV